MKITYFRLKGYVGIYHGMGLNEIVIPFNKFNSRIILIQGDNGCGKSTIMNALSTDIDGSKAYRTDYIIMPDGSRNIVEYPAEKEIHLIDKMGNTYQILIQSNIKPNGTRDTTKAFIQKNGEELNPKGNVNLYTSIRDDIFDIDSYCMRLSLVSSEDRGLVDKSPAERKDFLVNVIGNLEYYNDIYRTLSKKHNAYRSMINNISSKIYNIGDEGNLRGSLNSLTMQLKDLQTRRDEILSSIASNEATIRLLDPDGKIQTLNDSITDQLETINNEYRQFKKKLDTLLTKLDKFRPMHNIDNLSDEIRDVEIQIQNHRNIIDSSSDRISFVLKSKDVAERNLEDANMQLQSLESKSIRSDIVEALDDIKERMTIYNDVISNTDSNCDASISELQFAKVILNDIKLAAKSFNDKYSNSDIMNMVSIASHYNSIESIQAYVAKNIYESEERLNDLESRLQDISMSIAAKSSKLETVLDIDSKRPKECNIDTCPLLLGVFDTQENNADTIQDDLNKLYDMENGIRNGIDYEKSNISFLNTVKDMTEFLSSKIMYIVNNNIQLLEKLRPMTDCIIDLQHLITSIENKNQFNDFSYIDELISISDIKSQYDKMQTELIRLEADYKVYNSNVKLGESITKSISVYKKEIEDYDTEFKKLESDRYHSQSIISDLMEFLSNLQELKSVKETLSDIELRKNDLNKQYNDNIDTLSQIQKNISILDSLRRELCDVDKMITPISENISRINFDIANLMAYQQDLNKYRDRSDKIEYLKKMSSPTSGIQTLFMNIHFGKTILLCNELLCYLFGGDIKLLKPVINNKEFSIPFVNASMGDVVVPDISKGSTSQKCMISMVLSFALLAQGSDIYDIVRLDEIDGGLDQNNRAFFVTMLVKLINLLDVEQCIMISHNIELEDQSVDKIILTKQGISYLN